MLIINGLHLLKAYLSATTIIKQFIQNKIRNKARFIKKADGQVYNFIQKGTKINIERKNIKDSPGKSIESKTFKDKKIKSLSRIKFVNKSNENSQINVVDLSFQKNVRSSSNCKQNKNKYSIQSRLIPSNYFKNTSSSRVQDNHQDLIIKHLNTVRISTERKSQQDSNKKLEEARSVSPLNSISIMNQSSTNTISINIKSFERKESQYNKIDSILSRNESKLFPQRFSILSGYSLENNSFLPNIKQTIDMNVSSITPQSRSILSRGK